MNSLWKCCYYRTQVKIYICANNNCKSVKITIIIVNSILIFPRGVIITPELLFSHKFLCFFTLNINHCSITLRLSLIPLALQFLFIYPCPLFQQKEHETTFKRKVEPSHWKEKLHHSLESSKQTLYINLQARR